MDNYTVTATGLVIHTATGDIAVNIPNFQNLGINPNAEDYHNYDKIHVVGSSNQNSTKYISNENIIWNNLQEEPFPTFGLFNTTTPVINGSISDVPGLGHVTHYVDYTNKIIVNVTRGDHFLNPGVVVRYLYKQDGEYEIRSIGFGNGNNQFNFNEIFSDTLWQANVDRISRESIYEDNQPNHPSPVFAVSKDSLASMAEDAGLTIDQLLSIAENSDWHNRVIKGANGGDIYLTKVGDQLSFTAEDNDFAYAELKYQVDSAGRMIFGADGKPLIYDPIEAASNFGDEQGFLDIAGQKLVSWLDQAGMTVSQFFDGYADIATNPDTTVYEKAFGAFTYTGDFIESRIDQIFGHGAQIGFSIGEGFDSMAPEHYFGSREITQQNVVAATLSY